MKKFLILFILILLGLCIFAENTNCNSTKALRLECPQLSDDTLYARYVEYSTDDYGITFAYEFDCWKRASRWVCWQLHAGNSVKNTYRYNRFYEDDSIRAGFRIVPENFYMTGMSRGHFCPAQDRLCSREQNKQTFLLGTNTAPQYPKHNTGIWADIEDWIQDSLNNDDFRDTLYITKGATIDDDHIAGTTKRTGLIISQYWYCALLVLKDSTFHSIALLTEHTSDGNSPASVYDCLISVDSLECLTGLDFFCNLADSIEDAVEAQCNPTDWLFDE